MLELTEDAFIAKNQFQTLVLPMLREIGVRVSIDDFGTGYSSLSALADITADEIKVDRSFISAIHERPRSQSILRTIESLEPGAGDDHRRRGGRDMSKSWPICRPPRASVMRKATISPSRSSWRRHAPMRMSFAGRSRCRARAPDHVRPPRERWPRTGYALERSARCCHRDRERIHWTSARARTADRWRSSERHRGRSDWPPASSADQAA